MLKNLEKLNGFYISPYTPIEFVYDKDLKPLGYTFLLERNNYPFVMYGKFDLNFDLTEFYPWKLYNLSDKKSVEVVLKNKKVKPENALNQSVYFSVNAETLNIEDYYVRENSTIKSFNYKTSKLKHNYLDITTLPDYDSLENKKIAEFLKEKTPHYGFLYLDPPESDKNDIKKMLLAYSFSSELHKKYYDTLNMSHLIKRSLSLVGNSN